MLSFAWNTNKAKDNKKKHDITFDEASTVFADPLSLTIYDPLHSEKEDRFIIIGLLYKNRILTVVHTEHEDKVRIISSRKATANERSYYESYEK